MFESLLTKLEQFYEKTEIFIRILALVLVVIFFVPTTVVSCDEVSFTMEISPFDMAIGHLDYESNIEYEEIDSYLAETEVHIELFLILVFSVLILFSGSDTPIRSMVYSFLNIILIMAMHHTYIKETIYSMEIGTFISLKTTLAYDLFLGINILFLLYFGSYLLVSIVEIIYFVFNKKCECGQKLKLSDQYCPNCGKTTNKKEYSLVTTKDENNTINNTASTTEYHDETQH